MANCNKAEVYFKEKARMVKTGGTSCMDCPLDLNKNGYYLLCDNLELEHPKNAIDIVQKWSDEHPEKTILQDFLEKYPKAKCDDGVPDVCIKSLGYNCLFTCNAISCNECWNRPLSEVTDNE